MLEVALVGRFLDALELNDERHEDLDDAGLAPVALDDPFEETNGTVEGVSQSVGPGGVAEVHLDGPIPVDGPHVLVDHADDNITERGVFRAE